MYGAGQLINSASLAAQFGHVEMRVDVRTETLGALEIHAVLESGRLGASINAEMPEARNALAAHLPALEQSLSDRNVHVEHILISNDSTSNGEAGGGSDNHSQGNPDTPQQKGGSWFPDTEAMPEPVAGAEGRHPVEEAWRRLSVHA